MLKIISVMFAAITAIGCIELSGVFSIDVYAAYDLHSSGVMDEDASGSRYQYTAANLSNNTNLVTTKSGYYRRIHTITGADVAAIESLDYSSMILNSANTSKWSDNGIRQFSPWNGKVGTDVATITISYSDGRVETYNESWDMYYTCFYQVASGYDEWDVTENHNASAGTDYPVSGKGYGAMWTSIPRESGRIYKNVNVGLNAVKIVVDITSSFYGSYADSLICHYLPSTLNIDPNGGMYGGHEEVIVNSGLELGQGVLIQTPVRYGYTFNGWEYNTSEVKMETVDGKNYASVVIPDYTATITAKWIPAQYDVSCVDIVSRGPDTERHALSVKKKYNYGDTAKGSDWGTTSPYVSLPHTSVWGTWDPKIPCTYTGETTLDCKYTDIPDELLSVSEVETYEKRDSSSTYNKVLSINPNGGLIDDDASPYLISVDGRRTIKIPTPVRDGYTFVGWKTNRDFHGFLWEDEYDTATNVEEYVDSLVAIWLPELTVNRFFNDGTFKCNTLTYDGNGATSGSVEPQVCVHRLNERGEQGYPGTVYIRENGFVNPGNLFKGWNTKPDGSGNWYYPNQYLSFTEDLVLYAQWKDTYKVEVRHFLVDDEDEDNATLADKDIRDIRISEFPITDYTPYTRDYSPKYLFRRGEMRDAEPENINVAYRGYMYTGAVSHTAYHVTKRNIHIADDCSYTDWFNPNDYDFVTVGIYQFLEEGYWVHRYLSPVSMGWWIEDEAGNVLYRDKTRTKMDKNYWLENKDHWHGTTMYDGARDQYIAGTYTYNVYMSELSSKPSKVRLYMEFDSHHIQGNANWDDCEDSNVSFYTAVGQVADKKIMNLYYYFNGIEVTCIDKVENIATGVTVEHVLPEKKKYAFGTTARGSDWGTDSPYDGYAYMGDTQIKVEEEEINSSDFAASPSTIINLK